MDVVTEAVIKRPVEVVSRYAADPDRAPEWYVNIKSAEWLTEPPLSVGSRIAFHARFLRRSLRYTYEIVEYDPGKRLVMRTSEGPFPMETTYTWAAAGPASTRMTLRNRGEPSGFASLFSPFLGLAMRRANRHDLARLKQLLENPEGESADARRG